MVNSYISLDAECLTVMLTVKLQENSSFENSRRMHLINSENQIVYTVYQKSIKMQSNMQKIVEENQQNSSCDVIEHRR